MRIQNIWKDIRRRRRRRDVTVARLLLLLLQRFLHMLLQRLRRNIHLVSPVTSLLTTSPPTGARGRHRSFDDVTCDIIASVVGTHVAQDLLLRLALGGDEAPLGSGRKASVSARK